MRVPLILLFTALPSLAQGQADTVVLSTRPAAGARVAIRNFNGSIKVRPGSGDRLEVRAHIDAQRGGDPRDVGFVVTDLRVCTTYQGHGCDDQTGVRDVRVIVDYTVTLPRGLALTGFTGNGDIEVQQVVSDADLHTGNGDVHVSDASGLSAYSGNGDIVVGAGSGVVRLRTGNGAIDFKGHPVEIDANTGNGDVVAQIAGPAAAARRLTLTTGSGDVHLTLPADAAGDVDAQSGTGEINSAFDVRTTGRVVSGHLRGAIGSGTAGTAIRLRTGSGQVTIAKSS
jgi:hypothetical protein